MIIKFVVASVLLLAISCKKKEIEPTQKLEGDASLTIDEFVKKAPTPIQPAMSSDIPLGETVIDRPSGYYCTTTKVAKSFEYNEQIIINPQSDVVYPGSLIDGNSIINGEYTPINAARAPLTISTNMINLVGDKSITIENPTLSGVRSGIGALLGKGQDGSTAACMSFEYIDVTSEQNLKTAFGFSNTAGAEIKGGLVNISNEIKTKLSYESEKKKNKIIVRFIQSYYTIDVDKPTSPRSFLPQA